jgi:Uma2 family endonuclease
MTAPLAELLDKLMERPLSEADLEGLGRTLTDTGVHYELDEGRLILMSPMKSWHADVAARVRNVLVAQGRIAYQEQGVRLSNRRVRYADVSAFRQHPDPEASRHDPGDITLVVEVVSSDSERDDRVVKPGLYAEAGIPTYWILHLDARRFEVYTDPTGPDLSSPTWNGFYITEPGRRGSTSTKLC